MYLVWPPTEAMGDGWSVGLLAKADAGGAKADVSSEEVESDRGALPCTAVGTETAEGTK